MMLKFLKSKYIEVYAPLNGKVIPISKVNDQVFAQGMMGDGVAIVPDSSEIFAPVDGVVNVIAETNHSVCITTKEGLELIIHYGLDTVKYKGEGFKMQVKIGQNIKKGDLLFKADAQFFQDRNIDITSPILILNGDNFIMENLTGNDKVEAKKDVLFRVKIR